ncbi:MAG: hypothetical protein KJ950_14970 [Proteobacteria bacterium]|nr:hypothetical protein [Pseudomonadota bacterium]MBU1688637.1 hypothetical protein [Pseudomonadota bacterium]
MDGCIFIGTHSGVLDEKSRLVMPAGFRKDNSDDILSGDFYITPHRTGFVQVRPAMVWERYKQSIQSAEEFDGTQKRKFIRLLSNNTAKGKLDSQYRIVLTQGLRRKIHFVSDDPRQKVFIVGCGDSFEIWPEHLYRGEEDSTGEMSGFIDTFEGR